MRKFLFLFLLTFSFLSGYDYELGICCIFRDDANYLEEWIDFHLKQGVDHFWLYNNFSKDNYENVLKPYILSKKVTLIEWDKPHEDADSWVKVQNGAYMDCITSNKDNVNWIACIDSDEFLFLVKGGNIKNFLKKYESIQCLCVDWQMYGTNGINTSHGNMIKEILYRGSSDYLVATKCIVKPRFVVSCHFAHYFWVINQNQCVDENYKSVKVEECCFKKPSVDKIRINHYFCRDKTFFQEVKLKRASQQGRNSQRLIDQEKMCNSIYDDSILKVIY